MCFQMYVSLCDCLADGHQIRTIYARLFHSIAKQWKVQTGSIAQKKRVDMYRGNMRFSFQLNCVRANHHRHQQGADGAAICREIRF